MGKGCICKSRVEVRKLKEGITGKYALGGIKLSFSFGCKQQRFICGYINGFGGNCDERM